MVPPLPPLHGDLMLDVFTHRALTQDVPNEHTSHGNSDRLAQLGKSVLDTIVTYILFAERPMLSGEELKVKHDQTLSDESIVAWLTAYDIELKKRVRLGGARGVLDNPEEARFLINSYVGAVCIQDGLQAATDWISNLVMPEGQPPALVDDSQNRNSPTTSPESPAIASLPVTQASTSAPPPYYPTPPEASTIPSGVPQGTLALFNQTCHQRGFSVEWIASANGAQHDPRWDVKCKVNGVERGYGLGRNQKLAKELAAYEAYQYMQSIGWTLPQPEPTA
jgi:ribonuclease-3